MDKRTLSWVLSRSPAEIIKRLAAPILERYPVKTIRQPGTTLVMIRMRETVAKTQFYLGELLASEAFVELDGQKGFALLQGDDTEKAMAAAVIDALLKTTLPEKADVLSKLEHQLQTLQEEDQRQIMLHQRTRVQFQTMTP